MKNIFILLLLTFNISGFAQPQKDSSKRQYNLFHPTPKTLMREFSLDRPDATESAYTVDAGHFQLETDLFKTERSNIEGIKAINNFYNAANLKLGITHSLDLQVVVTTISSSAIKGGNRDIKEAGFGGLTLRAKQNIWGNDNGKTALAILPFVNIPVYSSEKISGGIVFPFALSLSHGWGFGAQLETDFTDDKTGDNYHIDILASATLSHSLFKNLDFFVESVIARDNELEISEYFLNGGLIFSVSNNINIDTGIYYGIKNSSSKTYFIGLSFRI